MRPSETRGHCERSEAIFRPLRPDPGDCFVATRLAMTELDRGAVAERASAVRVPVAVAQHAAGEGAGVLLILEQHLAVDDRVCDAFRGLLDAPATGREVVHNLFLAALHGGGIENSDVDRHARPQL